MSDALRHPFSVRARRNGETEVRVSCKGGVVLDPAGDVVDRIRLYLKCEMRVVGKSVVAALDVSEVFRAYCDCMDRRRFAVRR